MTSKGAALNFAVALLCNLYACPSFAQDDIQNYSKGTILEAFKPRVTGDVRMRYQAIETDNFPQSGEALTLRFLGTIEANLFEKTFVLAEVEGVKALVDDYNDGTDQRPTRPFIPDPEGIDLNRLQIISEAIPKTRITAGRQKLALDDWRFVGAFPFRQNSQTVDAIRFETKALGAGNLDAGYFNKVHRPLGSRNPNGVFSGDSYYLNYNIATPLGRFTAFHYALDLKTTADTFLRQNASSQTTGARLLGRRDWDNLSIIWAGSYARQTDYANNPSNYAADYALLEVAVKPGPFDLRVRGEVLGSDNGQSVQTPLASLHKFQGFADQFLTTPNDGVRDYSILGRYNFGSIGPISNVETFARHHWFESDTDQRSYGRELNLSLKATLNKTSFALEYADYKAETFSGDTRTLFLTTEISF